MSIFYSVVYCMCTVACSRVHISENTADFLSGQFQLEPGDGGSREEAIKMAGIQTFFVKSVVTAVSSRL